MSVETGKDELRVSNTLEVGQEAPDFELPDDEGQTVKLSDFRGKKNVLLAFYPFAFSIGCHTEFCTLRDRNADLVSDDNAEVFGVSVDAVWAIRAWKEKERFPNRFLSDFWPHGAVAAAYGAFAEKYGCAKRYSFVIDKQGIVRHIDRSKPGELPDQDTWRAVLADLG